MTTRKILLCEASSLLSLFSGKRGRLSKADFDTGWCNDDDERQCSLCQKYGDLKPNVCYAQDVKATLVIQLFRSGHSHVTLGCCSTGSGQAAVLGPKRVGSRELLFVVG